MPRSVQHQAVRSVTARSAVRWHTPTAAHCPHAARQSSRTIESSKTGQRQRVPVADDRTAGSALLAQDPRCPRTRHRRLQTTMMTQAAPHPPKDYASTRVPGRRCAIRPSQPPPRQLLLRRARLRQCLTTGPDGARPTNRPACEESPPCAGRWILEPPLDGAAYRAPPCDRCGRV
jgi:hypothetical protein